MGSSIRRVAVAGSGTMGLGIAHVAALGGFETALYDIASEPLQRARARIETNLQKGVDRGKLEPRGREEALARARAGYYRLLWDYASGNPGVALHFWRGSLRDDGQGGEVVRLFQSPSTSDLERLPDSTVFVLRSAIQLEWASPEDIARATMLSASSIEDALRYCSARSYLEQQDERYRVRWDWFRAITRFLQRRHLLVGGGA